MDINISNLSYEAIKENLSSISMYIAVGAIKINDPEGSLIKALTQLNTKLESYTGNGNK
mgnify:CR=1 FL=1